MLKQGTKCGKIAAFLAPGDSFLSKCLFWRIFAFFPLFHKSLWKVNKLLIRAIFVTFWHFYHSRSRAPRIIFNRCKKLIKSRLFGVFRPFLHAVFHTNIPNVEKLWTNRRGFPQFTKYSRSCDKKPSCKRKKFIFQ